MFSPLHTKVPSKILFYPAAKSKNISPLLSMALPLPQILRYQRSLVGSTRGSIGKKRVRWNQSAEKLKSAFAATQPEQNISRTTNQWYQTRINLTKSPSATQSLTFQPSFISTRSQNFRPYYQMCKVFKVGIVLFYKRGTILYSSFLNAVFMSSCQAMSKQNRNRLLYLYLTGFCMHCSRSKSFFLPQTVQATGQHML